PMIRNGHLWAIGHLWMVRPAGPWMTKCDAERGMWFGRMLLRSGPAPGLSGCIRPVARVQRHCPAAVSEPSRGVSGAPHGPDNVVIGEHHLYLSALSMRGNSSLHEALAPYADGVNVRLRGAMWLVSSAPA